MYNSSGEKIGEVEDLIITCNDLITSDALLDYITGFSLN